MPRSSVVFSCFMMTVLGAALGNSSGCGGSANTSGFGSGEGGAGGEGGGGSGSSSGLLGGSSSGGGGSSSGGVTVCPSGLSCDVSCSSGTTSISGTVMDPAGHDPLYNVVVYVPQKPLVALPKGVPTGQQACDCGALFPSGAVVSTTTAVDGTFKLLNAPVGSKVPLVVQVGKWRKVQVIDVKQCTDNAQGDIKLPSSIATGDTDDNMPDIAVSTGYADTLECLMTRIGLPKTEYTAGPGGTGHIHIFQGGKGTSAPTAGQPGAGENPGMAGAPSSPTHLWDSVGDMNPYDIVLLSCEGNETYDANPQVLESYLNGGGRVFASHYHYAWFSGPIEVPQSFKAPSDWGNNLATWSDNVKDEPPAFSAGSVDQTLNGSTQQFAKGVALYEWLGLNGALGVPASTGLPSAPAHDLPILAPRYNAVVGPSDKPSQPWITDTTTNNTMYFSFDTPVNAPNAKDGGPPTYCGRAVFSDLHVGSASGDGQSESGQANPPGSCNAAAQLSPQEKALEFMLFDLSSCVISDSEPPPDGGGIGITQ